jgi:polyribonucleotide nucleotidyltransferase
MVVAGTSDAVLMVESEAKELTEDQMLGAVLFAHDEFQVVIKAVKELAAEAAKPTWTWAPPEATELLGAIRAEFGEAISQAYTITVKADRYARLGELKDQVVAKLSGEEGQPSAADVKAAFGEIEYRTVRENIVNGKPRIDGRDTRTVRPLNIEVGVLPKTHGSALFTRGETQALVVATLGTARDAQLLDTLEGEKKTRSCCTTTSLRSRWASVVAWVVLVVAKSVTAVWPVVRFRPCCRPLTCSRTPSAWCRKSPSPTVPAPWLRSAALPWP